MLLSLISVEFYLKTISFFLGINTFGTHIILGMTLPLLIVAPFTLRLVFPNLTKSSKTQWDDVKRGELVLFQNDTQFHSEVFSVIGRYILCHAVRVSFKYCILFIIKISFMLIYNIQIFNRYLFVCLLQLYIVDI